MHGIGERVRRTEDPILLRGEGRYTDDLNELGQAYAWMVRSPHAHGVLRKIDLEKAKSMPGVLAVYTAADLAAYGPHKCMLDFKQRDGSAMKRPVRKSLASGKVRFVGDPVACVVANSAVQAKDAAEAVELDIEPLPAVALASAAAKPGAPQLYEDVPGNVALDFLFGEPEKVAEAFRNAFHVSKLSLRNTRVVVAAMEPRAALCAYDAAAGRWTLTAPGQGVFAMRNQLADILGVPQDKVRLRTFHVGGSFGMKGSIYPEYVCLAHASRALARPVKWTDERSGSFLSDQHGRDAEMTAELALDKDGRFLAVRVTGYGNVGAYLGTVALGKVSQQALQPGDVKTFELRKAEAKKRGKLRGLGIGSYLEVTAPPNKEMGGVTFEGDGSVKLITGTLDYGQGHAAPFAQVLAARLGVPFESIRLVQGDSDELVFGAGTGGSRSLMMCGAGVAEG